MELFNQIKKERQLIAFKSARLLLTQIAFLKAHKSEVVQDNLMHIENRQSKNIDFLYFTCYDELYQIWQDNSKQSITLRFYDGFEVFMTHFKLDFQQMDISDIELVIYTCHAIHTDVISKVTSSYHSFCDGLVLSDILPPQLLVIDDMRNFTHRVEILDSVAIAKKDYDMIIDFADLLVSDILSMINTDLKATYMLPNYCTLTCSDSHVDNGLYSMVFDEPSLERKTLFTIDASDVVGSISNVTSYDNGKKLDLRGGIFDNDSQIEIYQKIKEHISDKDVIVKKQLIIKNI